LKALPFRFFVFHPQSFGDFCTLCSENFNPSHADSFSCTCPVSSLGGRFQRPFTMVLTRATFFLLPMSHNFPSCRGGSLPPFGGFISLVCVQSPKNHLMSGLPPSHRSWFFSHPNVLVCPRVFRREERELTSYTGGSP